MVAAGYSNGRINLYHIENADILHSINLEGEITCMEWVCQFCPEDAEWKPDPYKEDNFRNYLPKLQPLNKRFLPIYIFYCESIQNHMYFSNQGHTLCCDQVQGYD